MSDVVSAIAEFGYRLTAQGPGRFVPIRAVVAVQQEKPDDSVTKVSARECLWSR
jgi:hypothetical protein